jgi:PAS domain S-box-containing protein
MGAAEELLGSCLKYLLQSADAFEERVDAHDPSPTSLPMSLPTPSNEEAHLPLTSRMARYAYSLVAITSTIATAAAVYTEANHLIVLSAALMALLGWLGVLLSIWLTPKTLAYVTVFGTLGIATFSVISFGSVRGSGSILFAAAVAAAGTFLGKRTLQAVVVISITAFGLLCIAESQGHLQPLSFHVGFITWFTYACVLLVIAGLVRYGRNQSQEAYARQERALQDNKRLAQERDRSLEQFARVFRTNPSPMITQSAMNGKILDVNPAFELCYGYSREEIVGQTDEVLWGQPSQRRSYLQELGRDKRVTLVNVSGLRANGTLFDAQISSALSDEGDDGLVITIVSDITAQVSAIERLRRSEDRFSKAFNLSPLKLIITRMSDDTVVEVNRADHRETEQAAIEYHDRPAREAGPWFSESSRAFFVQRLIEKGHLAAYPALLCLPDGRSIDAKVWAEQIDIDGEPCILSCIVDTTEEKRRDELLHDIAKGMTGHTAQAFFRSLTQRMANALDADKVFAGEIIAGHQISTLSIFEHGVSLDQGEFPLAGSAYEQSLLQKTLSVHPTGLSRDPDCKDLLKGTGIDAAVYQALHDAQGRPVGMLCAMWTHPITVTDEMRSLMAIFANRAHAELMRLQSERKIEQLNNTLEQRVLERTAELSKLNAELDSFAYSISHDLKSPLRAIDGFTQLLHERLQDRLDDEESRLMDRVLGATHRMANLMADLLALARVSQLPMHQQWLNLSMLAEREIKACLKRFPRPELRWHIEADLTAYADPDLAQAVLKHLIENAVQFSRDQAAPLIEIGRVTPAGAAPETVATFFVRDNGVGFAMEHADKLFKPFQRLHMPSAGFEGTGIGLATVRRIVERHGGTISGTGTPGLGAEFRFSLGQHAQATMTTE